MFGIPIYVNAVWKVCRVLLKYDNCAEFKKKIIIVIIIIIIFTLIFETGVEQYNRSIGIVRLLYM